MMMATTEILFFNLISKITSGLAFCSTAASISFCNNEARTFKSGWQLCLVCTGKIKILLDVIYATYNLFILLFK